MPGYAADCYVTGGQCAGSDDVIDTSGVLRGSSSTLYRSERFGECTYTIPVASGKAYAVALDFAETFYKARGQRVFNVSINGQAFLTNFDIVAAAGAPDKAIVETARGVRPDANGNIVIHLFNGPVDQPKICGIQIHVVRLGFD